MAAQPPKEKSYEDILKELQLQNNNPNEEGFAVKDKLGRLGDIVDPRNYPTTVLKWVKELWRLQSFQFDSQELPVS